MLPRNLLDLRLSFRKELGVPAKFNTGTRVLVVTGKNASGKSFLRRWFGFRLKSREIECITVSQQGRSTEGLHRVFMYGDEEWESTGSISAKTFLGGIRTSRSRRNPHVIIWDEPEIGMGEELQMGSADWLFQQLEEWPESLQGIILLTHSRYFVTRAMQYPGARFLNLDGYKSAGAWMKRKIEPISPEVLHETGMEKFRRLSKMLK